ncbi:hypothetical protein KSP35_06385 [Aquihabitans sp. G128]|uniref:hypothetical protein n=1 Tax=Aquihabitans sp. G128 TaxID=2849779 RepID=UPI001C25052E|nr:hypothetical protein [Aquihabitans sp. G128]QXC62425.1 hypothetical protein KSP35_06385 [Aquihabitans sp. G128]
MAASTRTDPWAATERRRTAGPGVGWRAAAAVVVAAVGLARVWNFGGRDWRTVAGGAAVLVAAEVALRVGWTGADVDERSLGRAALRPVAMLAAAAVGVPIVGATPAVVLVAVLVAADAALVEWRPFPGWPVRSRTVVPLAAGVLVASGVAWARGAPTIVVLAAIVVALAAVQAEAHGLRAVAAVDAALARGTSAVAGAIVAVALFLVALVVLYLPGAAVRALRALRRRSASGSSWTPTGTSVGDARQDARRPFTSTAPQVRRGRTIRGLALVAAVALVAVALVRRSGDPAGPDLPPGAVGAAGTTAPLPTAGPGSVGRQIFATEMALQYSQLPAYAGSSFADQLQVDEGEHVINGTKSTEYVNIRNGRRATLRPRRCDCKRATLWFSGGSAAFGTGQRDDHTIASELVRLAQEEDHIALDVTNVSHDGYTFQLETEWEVAQSLRTEEAPDLLVFYNGWNDVMAELAADYLKGPDPDRKLSTIIPAELQAISEDSDAFLRSTIGPAAGRAAAARYLRVQKEADALAKEAGVRTAYFLQADALSSAEQLRPYERLDGIPTEQLMASPIGQALDAMSAGLVGHVTDLRHLFDDDSPPVFLGLVHQNEEGARLVAERIYQDLRPQIRALAH